MGTASGLQTLYYAEIRDAMKVSEGGGNTKDMEKIEVVYVPVSEGKTLMLNENIPKPAAFIMALLWFYSEKRNRSMNKLCQV